MTVDEMITKINYVNRTIIELEAAADDGETIVRTAEIMRDAADLLEEYSNELGRKKVV